LKAASEATVHMWRMAARRRESLESSSPLRKGTEDGPVVEAEGGVEAEGRVEGGVEEGTVELVGTAGAAVEGRASAAGVVAPVGVMGDDVGCTLMGSEFVGVVAAVGTAVADAVVAVAVFAAAGTTRTLSSSDTVPVGVCFLSFSSAIGTLSRAITVTSPDPPDPPAPTAPRVTTFTALPMHTCALIVFLSHTDRDSFASPDVRRSHTILFASFLSSLS
jgi:hypothetical protein